MIFRNPYRPLERALGYRFKRRALLEQALTHASYRHEHPEIDSDNQRLEFLGDAVLNLIAAEWFYAHYPSEPEGRLSQLRAGLTSTETLADVAAHIALGDFLRLGRGAQGSGSAQRPRVLADALEAIIGGAYLDGGLRAVRRIFAHLFAPRVSTAPLKYESDNWKGILQDLCVRHWGRRPEYVVVEESGPPHAKVFTCEVRLEDRVLGSGRGTSRKKAEMQAAAEAVQRLEGSGELLRKGDH